MTISETSPGTTHRCRICGEDTQGEAAVASGPESCCRSCGNPLAWEESALPRISLSAFPILDQQTMRVFERIGTLVDESTPAVVELDFRGVKFLSSAALGKLIALAHKASGMKARVVLWNVNSTVEEVLQITNLRKLFSIKASP